MTDIRSCGGFSRSAVARSSSEVHEKIRDVRAEGANNPTTGVLDAAETSEADIQDDIEFALIQMKAETLDQDRRGPPSPRRGHVRLLLRVRRRDLRAPAAGAAVRAPLQGLRGGPRGGAAARAHPVAGGVPPRSSWTFRDNPGLHIAAFATSRRATGRLCRSPTADRRFRVGILLQSRRRPGPGLRSPQR